MPRLSGLLLALLLMALARPTRAGAQASPYLLMDDPRLPLIEHLIARGEVRDPSPLERPFRTGDLVAALRASTSPIAARLAAELAPVHPRSWSRLTVRAGAQAFTQGRRDLLQDGGTGSLGGTAEIRAEVVSGPLVFVARPILDTRLSHDPDFPVRQFLLGDRGNGRFEVYWALQMAWGSLQVGQMARNWGPTRLAGVPISDAAYPRPDIGLTLGRGAIRFSSIATRMRSDAGVSGETIQRYYVAHRLSVRAARSFTVVAWEVGVIAGTADQLDGVTRVVVPLLVVPALFASRSHRNEMVGGDFSWRPSPRLRIEGQLAIDDWNFDANNPYPQRWAGAVTGSGALGAVATWRASYTTASSLAFRTLNPEENIVDQGIGIGRLLPDNDLLDLSVDVPVHETWLVTPRVALLRQGEGRIQSPFPTFQQADSVPARFIGVRANSLWAGVGVSGWRGPLQISGEGGVRHTTNAGHVTGATTTTLEGRLTATLGFSLGKADQ